MIKQNFNEYNMLICLYIFIKKNRRVLCSRFSARRWNNFTIFFLHRVVENTLPDVITAPLFLFFASWGVGTHCTSFFHFSDTKLLNNFTIFFHTVVANIPNHHGCHTDALFHIFGKCWVGRHILYFNIRVFHRVI